MHVGIETRGFTVLMIENMQEFPFFKRQIIPRSCILLLTWIWVKESTFYFKIILTIIS